MPPFLAMSALGGQSGHRSKMASCLLMTKADIAESLSPLASYGMALAGSGVLRFVSNEYCDVSALSGAAFKPSAAPLLPS